MRRLLAVSLLLAAPAATFAQSAAPSAAPAGRQPLTHEALWMMKRVGAPAVSPDGRWAVFSVTEPSYDEKKEVNDLWIVPVDGSAPPRRLTSAKGNEAGAAWSPDSRRLAFAAKRDDDEVNQIYVLDLARGGEAQRLTRWPLAARSPVWSPDGRRIAFQAGVYPGAEGAEAHERIAKERKDAKSKVRAYDGFPIRRWDRWLDDTRTGLFVVDVDGDGTARNLLAGTALAGQPGFGGGPGGGSSESYSPVWSPDGAALVFVATTNRDASAYSSVNTHLFEIPAAGGEPRALTTGNAGHASPQFSPDGKRLCYRVGDEWDKIYALDRLACGGWPWSSSAPTVVTASVDRSVGDFAFAPDGRTIYFTTEDQGFVRLFAVPAAGGAAAPVLESRGVFSAIEVPEAGKTAVLVAAWGSATEPTEIVRVDPATKRKVNLTSFNVSAAAALDWQPLQEFWFTNGQGRKVHSFVVLPQGFDPAKKYPVLALIHGGHASMWSDSITYRWNYHLLASPGYVLVLTDYRGSTGYGEAFTLDILGDPLRGPAEDVNQAVDEAIRRYPFIDASRQCAGGASYGGHLANWLEASTTRYKCLISHAGLSSLVTQWSTSDSIRHRETMMGAAPWEKPEVWADQSPVAYAKDFKTPMLLTVGENDFRVPMNNTLEMYAVLQRMQVPARLLVFPDENHWILKGENSKVFYEEVHDWLARWLK